MFNHGIIQFSHNTKSVLKTKDKNPEWSIEIWTGGDDRKENKLRIWKNILNFAKKQVNSFT